MISSEKIRSVTLLTILSLFITCTFSVNGCKGNSSAKTSAASQAGSSTEIATASAKPQVYEPLQNPFEISLSIVVKTRRFEVSPAWAGAVAGEIESLKIGDREIELEKKGIIQDGGKSWIATKKFGRIRVAGAEGPYDSDYASDPRNLGSQVFNYFADKSLIYADPGGNPAIGVCVWLTPLQKAQLMEIKGPVTVARP
jgi:hypothetical protein